jgi:hypothetical protein
MRVVELSDWPDAAANARSVAHVKSVLCPLKAPQPPLVFFFMFT